MHVKHDIRALLLVLLAVTAWSHAIPDSTPQLDRMDQFTRMAVKVLHAPDVPIQPAPGGTAVEPAALPQPEPSAFILSVLPALDALSWHCRRQSEGG